MTPATLAQALGIKVLRADQWAPHLSAAMDEYGIAGASADAFLANVAHESEGLQTLEEIWGPTAVQKRYDQRADLGNTFPRAIQIARANNSSPGYFFRGFGPIQTTGFDNIQRVSLKLFGDERLAENPKLLTTPAVGSRAAGFFWNSKGLNTIAAPGTLDSFQQACAKVNTGRAKRPNPKTGALETVPTNFINGWEDRLKRWTQIKRFTHV